METNKSTFYVHYADLTLIMTEFQAHQIAWNSADYHWIYLLLFISCMFNQFLFNLILLHNPNSIENHVFWLFRRLDNNKINFVYVLRCGNFKNIDNDFVVGKKIACWFIVIINRRLVSEKNCNDDNECTSFNHIIKWNQKLFFSHFFGLLMKNLCRFQYSLLKI